MFHLSSTGRRHHRPRFRLRRHPCLRCSPNHLHQCQLTLLGFSERRLVHRVLRPRRRLNLSYHRPHPNRCLWSRESPGGRRPVGLVPHLHHRPSPRCCLARPSPCRVFPRSPVGRRPHRQERRHRHRQCPRCRLFRPSPCLLFQVDCLGMRHSDRVRHHRHHRSLRSNRFRLHQDRPIQLD